MKKFTHHIWIKYFTPDMELDTTTYGEESLKSLAELDASYLDGIYYLLLF